ELYLGFINNLPLGVYRTSANGTLHFANKGLVELLGYTSVEELYSENIKDFYVNHDLRDQILTDWPDDKMHSFEFQIYNKDKQIIWVKDSGRAIKDRNGKIIFMDGILEDISKQKENELKLRESENKLKELNASKDKFFSIISHDLRSPFNQLIGATELLLTKLDEYDKVMIRKFLTLLNVEAVQSYRLLENLLQWSKNQRGLIQFDPKPVNLPKLIDDLLLIYAPMATDKKIDIELDIQRDLHYYADKEMLSTIMRNLISNAIKFTDKNGLITIIAKEKMDEENMLNEYLEVSVSDTGVGIPEDTLPKIFTINEANSSKGTYNEFGSGLGLVLCKDFVERHNGDIWVESTYGEGSTFYFTLK
ncbi:MAG: PAS domain-containing sensor histidine kinase, partial [Bacteroidales bacterium]|nr:PAS domain-containing sensor histidine kinase [Bacteroidales bacterium]